MDHRAQGEAQAAVNMSKKWAGSYARRPRGSGWVTLLIVIVLVTALVARANAINNGTTMSEEFWDIVAGWRDGLLHALRGLGLEILNAIGDGFRYVGRAIMGVFD